MPTETLTTFEIDELIRGWRDCECGFPLDETENSYWIEGWELRRQSMLAKLDPEFALN